MAETDKNHSFKTSKPQWDNETAQSIGFTQVLGRAVQFGDMTTEQAWEFYQEHIGKIIGHQAVESAGEPQPHLP
jgi:hypothetical protein